MKGAVIKCPFCEHEPIGFVGVGDQLLMKHVGLAIVCARCRNDSVIAVDSSTGLLCLEGIAPPRPTPPRLIA